MKYLVLFIFLSSAAFSQVDSTLDYERDGQRMMTKYPDAGVVIDSLRRVIAQTAPEGSWDDERVPITALRVPGTGAPGWTILYKDSAEALAGVGSYCFDDAIEESVYFTLQIPHTWQGSVDGYDSTLNFHVHWLTTGPDTGSVVWGLEYTWASISGGDSTAATTYGPYTNVAYTSAHPISINSFANTHLMSNFPVITKPNMSFSSMLICRFFRVVGDLAGTLTPDACVIEIDCHILKRPRGTRSIYSDD